MPLRRQASESRCRFLLQPAKPGARNARLRCRPGLQCHKVEYRSQTPGRVDSARHVGCDLIDAALSRPSAADSYYGIGLDHRKL
jgi:hypothetical protein